ncbi:MAG: TetR/AcrR family transcriptional regulator [Rhizomicrobium sp.]|jgi:AcrR family transcriptional regulator
MDTDTDTPTRWRRRKEARPQEILEAALMVFAEKGYASARMDDIAARAGVTKGTIYLYFDNKEAVFKTLVRDSIGDTLARVVEAAERFEGSASDLLRLMLRTIGQFVRTSDRVVLPKIVIGELGNFPELMRFYREEVVEKGLAALGSVISRGVARGEFRDVAPEHAARLCIAPILLAAVWRTTFARIDSETYDLEGLIETHIDVLLRGLARGEAP